jgi:hypothetical protein
VGGQPRRRRGAAHRHATHHLPGAERGGVAIPLPPAVAQRLEDLFRPEATAGERYPAEMLPTLGI